MTRYSLTAIGSDRPGIVAAVTKVLFTHNCNIEDSSMTILADEFAMILITSIPEDANIDALKKDLTEVELDLALGITLREILEDSGNRTGNSTHLVTVSGSDRPGIVYKTVNFLAKWDINITDLATKVIKGEEKPLYIMLMEVRFPENLDDETIKSSIKTLGESMNVKIEIKEIESYDDL